MGLRTRKLVGSIGIFLWMVVFSLAAMAILGSIDRPHVLIEIVLYAVLGFGWILPLKPIFVWMGKAPRPDEKTSSLGIVAFVVTAMAIIAMQEAIVKC